MSDNITKTSIFIDLYRELEESAKTLLNIPDGASAIFNLANHPDFQHFKQELDYCREVRNLLSHRPKIKGQFGVEPSDEMIHMLSNMLELLKNPPKAMEVAVSREKILMANLNDLVLPIMQKMKYNNFSHVPIMKNDLVIGVFSESTIFDYLADHEIIEIPKDAAFKDYLSYIGLSNHRNEEFMFVPRSILVGEIETLFQSKRHLKRLELVFITETGKKTEKILAMISPWDLMGQDLK